MKVPPSQLSLLSFSSHQFEAWLRRKHIKSYSLSKSMRMFKNSLVGPFNLLKKTAEINPFSSSIKPTLKKNVLKDRKLKQCRLLWHFRHANITQPRWIPTNPQCSTSEYFKFHKRERWLSSRIPDCHHQSLNKQVRLKSPERLLVKL